MIKTLLLNVAMFLIGIPVCAAQESNAGAPQWGVYTPDMKFADVFGRPAAVEKDGVINSSPSLAEIAAPGGGANIFLKHAVNDLLAPVTPGASSCRDMSALKLPWVRITSAETVAADKGVRAYCKVIGVIDKEITFEVDMPDAAAWNGKFLMGGGGGFLGNLQNGVKPVALFRGYATAATDTGHPIPADGGGSWADHDPERLVNWGYRGTHLAQANAKLVIQAYYKKAIAHSYYYGMSGSGRVALMEAERFPSDFSGIVAACPVASWTKLNGVATAWTQQAMFPTMADEFRYRPVVPVSKVKMLDDAVYAKCDARDGLKDDVITNPLACQFNPMTDLRLCKAGEDKPDCFTQQQAAVIAKIHDGPSNTLGRIYPGWAYGGENVPGMWAQGGAGGYVIGTAPKPGAASPYASRHYLLNEETLRHVIFNDPNYDLHSFNFDTDLPALQVAAAQIDPDNPDLSGFSGQHGKLIMSVGWSDWAVGALVVKDFYDQIVARNGGPGVTAEFARLFMLPGVGHCFAADPARKTTNTIDYLTALENWVEHGQAPASIVASHVVASGGGETPTSMPITGTVDRTRPICAYPALAIYKGKGNIDDAANFTCKAS
jgi:feruloyl esterase